MEDFDQRMLEQSKLSPIRLDSQFDVNTGLSKGKENTEEMIDHSHFYNDQTTPSGLNQSTLLGKKPHGFISKTSQSLTNTPLVESGSPIKSAIDAKDDLNGKAPLTSPIKKHPENISNLDSAKHLQRVKNSYRTVNDNSNKENVQFNDSFNKWFYSSPQLNSQANNSQMINSQLNSQLNSSPVNKKRSNDNSPSNPQSQTPHKMAKVVTNANNTTTDITAETLDGRTNQHKTGADEEYGDDFQRVDIVASLSAKNSPRQLKTSPSRIDQSHKSVIEDDNEEEEDNQLVQTQSQDQKDDDHITPLNRFTEPVAKSPATNQLQRIGTIEEESNSPTKSENCSQIQEEVLEKDEPTVKFLVSTNSKLTFSLNDIEKLKAQHDEQLSNMNKIINQKNEKILKLTTELNEDNFKLISYETSNNDLKKVNNDLSNNNEYLQIQLKHNELELAKSTKSISSLNQEVAESKKANNAFFEDKAVLTKEKDELNNENNQLKEEIGQLRGDANELNLKIEQLTQKEQEMSVQNNELKRKHEEDLETLNAIEKELGEVQERINQMKQESEQRQKEKENLDIKVKSLEQEMSQLRSKNEDLNSEYHSLMKANNDLQQQLGESGEATKKVQEMTQELEQLKSSNEAMANDNSYYQDMNQKLIKEKNHISTKVDQLVEQVDQLESTNKHKDSIIQGDTKQMQKLDQQIEQLKQQLSNELHPRSSINNVSPSSDLRSEVSQLKTQLSNFNNDKQREIEIISEKLFHQYSKKHEFKINQIKLNYSNLINNLKQEKKNLIKDIQLLQKKNQFLVKDNEHLLKIIDDKS